MKRGDPEMCRCGNWSGNHVSCADCRRKRRIKRHLAARQRKVERAQLDRARRLEDEQRKMGGGFA